MDSTSSSGGKVELGGKRRCSPDSADRPGNAEAKEAKVSSEPQIPNERLHLSVLRWDGIAMVWNADGDGPEKYGAYIHALKPSLPLARAAWSEPLAAFTYTVAKGQPKQFVYKRETTLQTYDPEYEDVFGDAHRQNPMFLVHRPLGARPGEAFRFKATPTDFGGVRDTVRPPFAFKTMYNMYMKPSAPTQASILRLGMPDLKCHLTARESGIGLQESDDEDDQQGGVSASGSIESFPDACHFGPWGGSWTRQFIRDAKSGHPLESLEKIIWDERHVIGVKVKLEPVAGSVQFELDEDIFDWNTRRVYVTPKFFEIPDTPQDEGAPDDAEDLTGSESEEDLDDSAYEDYSLGPGPGWEDEDDTRYDSAKDPDC
ncbi:hypothetical protein EVG20_g1330 [Dentipellis fragilis]|uniref:Uncharacterized protein n=1 Tax=Dentipellis fragilis TaxID=205917 RepID=A0A4Y9ZCV8_9AGAM|nr:hypothetical protein EVG20_g1330 [Dentipellis fragilis]